MLEAFSCARWRAPGPVNRPDGEFFFFEFVAQLLFRRPPRASCACTCCALCLSSVHSTLSRSCSSSYAVSIRPATSDPATQGPNHPFSPPSCSPGRLRHSHSGCPRSRPNCTACLVAFPPLPPPPLPGWDFLDHSTLFTPGKYCCLPCALGCPCRPEASPSPVPKTGAHSPRWSWASLFPTHGRGFTVVSQGPRCSLSQCASSYPWPAALPKGATASDSSGPLIPLLGYPGWLCSTTSASARERPRARASTLQGWICINCPISLA